MEKVNTLKGSIDPATGYKANFTVSGKTLTDNSGLIHYKPHQVKIRNYFRINGNAKPENNAIAYLLETFDGKKGVLVYNYDVFTDSKVFNFLKAIVDFRNRASSLV